MNVCSLTFWRIILPLTSGLKCKVSNHLARSKQQAEPKDGGSTSFWNTAELLLDYMVTQPRKTVPFTQLLLWKPQMQQFPVRLGNNSKIKIVIFRVMPLCSCLGGCRRFRWNCCLPLEVYGEAGGSVQILAQILGWLEIWWFLCPSRQM
jgi:hypothetical protein